MNQLQRQALASLALSKETVLSWYLGYRSNSAERVKALCVSHERLRAELEEFTALIEWFDAKITQISWRNNSDWQK